MNNKAHLRPSDYDSNGDIIPMSWKEEKGDLISREALKKAISELSNDNPSYWNTCDVVDREKVFDEIDNAPTVTLDMEFAKWVTKMIFDNNTIKDFDFELFSELACRKLEKLGLVEKTESEWIKKGGAE